jgi:hypothetical protein
VLTHLSAVDRNDYLVYNQKTGVLSFDPDGKGSTKQIPILQFAAGFNLTAQNVTVL